MSRFYNIVLTPAAGGNPVRQYASTDSGLVSGQWIPGALQVELDLPVAPQSVPISQAMIRIHGIPLIDISQAADFAGLQCQVFGGMGAGLPLAKPSQAGLLVRGQVWQSFANWVGTDQTLDLVVIAAAGKANIVLNWKAGQPLGQAIAEALQVAFPTYKDPVDNSFPFLVRDSPSTGTSASVEDFASSMKDLSISTANTPGYSGVEITFRDNQFFIYDNTSPSAMPNGSTQDNPKQIDFMDLIGQPTWFEPGSIQFNCPMRADIVLGDFVRLPKGPVTTLQPSMPQARSKTAFAGVFQIVVVRHLGSYRQGEASSWMTTFNATVQDPSAFAVSLDTPAS